MGYNGIRNITYTGEGRYKERNFFFFFHCICKHVCAIADWFLLSQEDTAKLFFFELLEDFWGVCDR